MFHVKIGTRHIVMPGARIRNTVVRMLMPGQERRDRDEREPEDPQVGRRSPGE